MSTICQALIRGKWSSRPCGCKAAYEHEGKFFCKTHHPPTIKAKRDASHEKWKQEFDRKRQVETLSFKSLAEQKRRADLHPELLEALQGIYDACDGYVPNTSKAIWNAAREAIAKALGDGS